ncbi:PTS sugar transporter subunit IIA [Corynebacterium sp. zg-331]|uniref:PTS fructose transporter subunit IIABC n=1 Tax=unclassified Corynebacterium TaxID=2624378 RepID=UPI00128C750D|nr:MULTISPECIES: fructose-specific PTS transporter subunit EIIC [unclassified Corynebacterium]MBC3185394.1 PTS sugar transporter subunit IIA [Corynebacterium sp. zg-331]MPV51890.1 PTS lactose transporter subunit IIC [Corynebacterium sp. zg331]
MNAPLITTDLVGLDIDAGTKPATVIEHLARLVSGAGRATDPAVLAHDARTREEKSGTGVPGGVAIPHCRSAAVTEPTLAFARLHHPVDFSGPDGPASLVFLIAAPDGGGKEHLKILSKLARALVRPDFLEGLRGAGSAEEIVALVTEVIQAAPRKKKPTEETGASDSVASSTRRTRIVAVTACPTGIAHTYMAADALTHTADARPDIELSVEPQGSSAVTPLPAATIEAADAVIFATDVGVKDRERFAGKPVIESGVKRAINEPGVMLDEAVAAATDPGSLRVAGDPAAAPEGHEATPAQGSSLSWGKRIQQAVMTGVSYMVPFVAAGGLLLALGYLLGGRAVGDYWQVLVTEYSLTNLPDQAAMINGQLVAFDQAGLPLYLAAVFFATGQAAMGFVVAALSGYIAYALANRPGIAPGFVGGALSVALGAGFIGGLVTGILAGLIAMWIGSWRVPRWVASLMPVVIIPLLSSMIVGLAMFLLLGKPLEAIMTGLQDWLNSMSGSSAVLLGVILGLMMCFDLGGPVNKAAYLFATAGLSTGDESSMTIMAAVMASGMVPPIALSLATFLRSSLFTPVERENGKSSWLLGLSFVSEGAIPFAAADPLRVIPSMMAGGAVTGALSMAFGVTASAPHGGIFVLPAISPAAGWVLSLAAGIAVSTVAVLAMKQLWPTKAVAENTAARQIAEPGTADPARLK